MTFLYYFGAVASSATQSALTKTHHRYPSTVYRFNFFKSLFAFLFFMIAFLISREGWHLPTLLYGCIFGVCMVVSMQAGYIALSTGPLSLTSMTVSFSLVIPCLYGIIFRKEQISHIVALGFVLLISSLLCINLKPQKADKEKQPLTLKWALAVALTLLSNGICSIVQAEHQRSFPASYHFSFLCAAMGVCLLTFLVFFLAERIRTQASPSPKAADMIAGGAGITNGLSNFFSLTLAAMSPASILFPLLSVCTMLTSLLVGRVIFGEKLSMGQLIGFCLGVAAVFYLKS